MSYWKSFYAKTESNLFKGGEPVLCWSRVCTLGRPKLRRFTSNVSGAHLRVLSRPVTGCFDSYFGTRGPEPGRDDRRKTGRPSSGRVHTQVEVVVLRWVVKEVDFCKCLRG